MHSTLSAAVFAFSATSLFAQSAMTSFQEDLQTVRSPDGRIEFQIFVGQPVVTETSVLPRMAYRVLFQSKPLLETSFLGFELREQNPLGEKPGLNKFDSGSSASQGKAYNWGIAHFLQNGSQGRLYDVEARVYDTGIAFRYYIPWSAPMEFILIEGENTEFQFPAAASAPVAQSTIADLPTDRDFPLPFVVEQPGLPLVSISQSVAEPRAAAGDGLGEGGVPYPRFTVRHDTSSVQGPTMVTQLPRLKDKPWIAVDSRPPFTTPWRVIAIAPSAAEINPPLR
jgi:alpha-glucosidase